MSRKFNRLRHAAINLALIGVSLLVGYAVLGSLLLVYGPAVAWKPFNKFPTAATIPWQPSGPKSKEAKYLAILGDSYAAGMGDWNANRNSRIEPYYSGDVISDALGVPVLSFGKNGAGSVDALVTNPGHIMNADSCLLMQSPPAPDSMVVYVYEGNDFNNNLRDLGVPIGKAVTKDEVRKLIESKARSVENVPCYIFVRNIALNLIDGYRKMLSAREYIPDRSTGQAVMLGNEEVYVPNELQGPALELDETALDAGFEVLSQSLDYLMQRFPSIPVLVVDVPAVLTPYRIVNDTVSTSTPQGGEPLQPTRAVRERSDALCTRMRDLILAKGASFLDARPALAKVAAEQEIHGPLDWRHLNRSGQTVLGLAVAAAIKDGATDSGCAILSPAS